MDLTVLHEFAVLAQRLNYAQAARELNVSTSTLSRHISALERELGVPLFSRSGRTALEPAGRILLEEAGALFASEERISQRLASVKAQVQGTILLEDYLFSHGVKNFLVTAARRFKSMYPNVMFQFVRVHNGQPIPELLASGELDVGVLVHTGPWEPEFSEGAARVVPLWHERSRMGIYTLADQLLPGDVEDGQVAIDVLRRLSLLMPLRPEYGNFQSDIRAFCASHGFEPELRLVSTGSLEDLVMIDMTGCAQIVLESDLLDPANPFGLDRSCSFYPIREKCWAVPYLLLPEQAASPVARAFADLLRDLAREFADEEGAAPGDEKNAAPGGGADEEPGTGGGALAIGTRAT